MSKFDCKVSELNSTKKDERDIKLSSVRENNSINGNLNGNLNGNGNGNVSESISFYDKIVNEKHLKIISLISIIHFVLHSEVVLEFLHSKIPSVMLNLTQLNTFGKLLVGFIISIILIIYTSFFQVP
jgi:hypothetical protein